MPKRSARLQRGRGKLISVNSLLALEEGGTAIVSGTMLAGAWQERYTLHGGNATMEIDAFSELRFYSEGVQKTWKEPYPAAAVNLKGGGLWTRLNISWIV